MVNPYDLSSRRASNKNQPTLGKSQALKKSEKYIAKLTQSLERQSNNSSPNKARRNSVFDSSKEDDDDDEDPDRSKIIGDEDSDDDDDESSSFNLKQYTSNKFLKTKKKPPPAVSPRETVKSRSSKSSENKLKKEPSQTPIREETIDTNQSDLEISIGGEDRSPTPSIKGRQSGNRILSATSSVSSFGALPKRSPSRVKFVHASNIDSEEDNDEPSSMVEDLLSKNLVLSIDDLEAASVSNSPTKLKVNRKKSKSPLATRRSESVASIIEEEEFSSITPSIESPSILENPNLILDLNEYEKSLNQFADEKKASDKKKKKKSEEKQKTKSKKTSKDKHKKKSSKDTTETIDSSIVSELEIVSKMSHTATDSESEIKTFKSEESTESRATLKKRSKSYQSDFETDQDFSVISQRTNEFSFKPTNRRKSSATSTTATAKKSTPKTNVEVQVDQNDLLKYSDLLKSVNVYNPSSLLLSSMAYLNDSTSLRDLNQLTGYNLINQTFNDLIKMNLSYLKNFLSMQRNLYEQQIQSIQPK